MMETVQLWLYIATATLLVVHEIDSAFWKEWDLLHFFDKMGFRKGDMIQLELKI